MSMIISQAGLLVLLTATPLCAVSLAKPVDVLKVARSFPDGGGYEWKRSGVPEAIVFEGQQILPKGTATYCSGFTFAVVMKAAQQRKLLVGKSVDDIRAFQKNWYGASKESAETQCVLAMQKLGVGEQVSAEQARLGDFLQLWRTDGSGHSVVFVDWIVEDGRPIGLKYRSTQKATSGIGERIEYFTGAPCRKGLVDPQRIYFCRLFEKPSALANVK